MTVADETGLVWAGAAPCRRYDLTAPQGVRARNGDNTRIRKVLLGWPPSIPLEVTLERTYRWIHDQMAAEMAA